MYGLLTTKLRCPSLQPKQVQRPYIIERLNEGLELNRLVTLVSAPAGFGKTTCISEWVNTLEDRPVTWFSIDPSDDDPGRFFAYFLAALHKVDANLGREIEGVIRSGQLPASEIISTALINDLSEVNRHILLVLDDFHVIQDQFIYQVMEHLVTNLPPSLHLVLITREDPPLPLARLRANNQLTEVRARDLRFTRHDSERFLNEVMGLSLSASDIARLENKTEGWIVGLQLAGLSIRDREDPSNFILGLSGSHRHILGYLTEQVLNRQPEDIQRFLLQTSILDKLNGDLCNAVTGRRDGHALLERLFNANLFVIPLDDEGQWYRYHHLFADLLGNLQNALPNNKTTELHQRASRWYAQSGLASEAIQHALAAKDYPLAVEMLEDHALKMIMQGYAKTVNSWVQAIPEEWEAQSPRTNLALAWAYLLRGAYSQASQYLERLRATLIDSPFGEENPAIRAEWLVMQSLNLYMQGKITECMHMTTQALEIAPQQDSRVRSLAHFVQGSVCQIQENYPQAVNFFQMSIQHGRVAGNLVAEMMSTASLAGMALEHGQLHQAFEIASQAVERIELSGVLYPISAVVYAVLGDVYHQWCQFEEARRHLLHAIHLSQLGGSNTITILCGAILSHLFQMKGDLEAAAHEIQKANDLLPIHVPEYVRQEVVSQQVCICLAQNRPAAARLALEGQGFSFEGQISFPDLPGGKNIPYSLGKLYNKSLHFLLYQAQYRDEPDNLRPGIEMAEQLITRAFQSQQLLVAMETLLLRARMQHVLGNHRASQADYVTVLELAEPEDLIGIFVEQGRPVAEALANLAEHNQLGPIQPGFVRRILEAFPATLAVTDKQPAPGLPGETGPMTLIEPLTEREMEVLRLMAEGLKYREIATRLFITLNTVRFHVKVIYGKLNVSNRTQAIAEARQIHIL